MDDRSFIPLAFLENSHVMTIAAAIWPRRFTAEIRNGQKRLFEVEPGTKVVAKCHWQRNRPRGPNLVVLHGMEGSFDSHYVLGLAQKAYACGMNVICINMRNCGGTTDLTPTLYNGGMSQDVLAIVRELKERDGLTEIMLAGCSLGGNIMLKAAAELGERSDLMISAVCAISPSVDLAASVRKLQEGFNRFYQQRFLQGLKAKLKEKQRHYPDLYDLEPLREIKTVRQFDEVYTAPFGGFSSADEYYRLCSSLPLLNKIRVPALIVQAQDDPIVPFESFTPEHLNNRWITLLAPEHGGHGGFLHRRLEKPPVFDRFWAENRVISFCLKNAGERSVKLRE